MIHLDFETFSEVNLRTCGAFKYAEHESTEVLIAGFAFGSEAPLVESPYVTDMLNSPAFKKLCNHVRRGDLVGAHNAQFEWVIWNVVLRKLAKWIPPLKAKQMRCTAARAAVCSLPRSLEGAGFAMNLGQLKDKAGQTFLKMFCMPRKPTKADARTRILPTDDPAAFKRFMHYCGMDVVGERKLERKLPVMSEEEELVWQLDLKINARGLPIDIPYVRKAQVICTQLENSIKARVRELTKDAEFEDKLGNKTGISPTQVAKMKEYFNTTFKAYFDANDLEAMENLQATTVRDLLLRDNVPTKLRKLLQLRVEAGKVSTKKLGAMLRVACRDHRARGCLLFYGAHTGRWSGKLVQPHNYIRGLLKLHQQDRVFKLIANGDAELFEMLFDWPINEISQCMRGFIKSEPGKKLLIADYSAIEARVLAWCADEQEMLQAYFAGVDVYKMMASFLYDKPIDGVTDEERRLSKNIVLGCGYGLGAKKFIAYCAKQGILITEEMSWEAVSTYRSRNKKTVEYWSDVERAAIHCIETGEEVTLHLGITFLLEDEFMCIRLPSGRKLYYPFPKVDWHTPELSDEMKEWERINQEPHPRRPKPRKRITFRTEFFGKWVREGTYGGKLVENIVQAISRDIMVNGMLNCENIGYPLIGTVHDELITEVDDDDGYTVKELEQAVCSMPEWAASAPVEAKGFMCYRYRKG